MVSYVKDMRGAVSQMASDRWAAISSDVKDGKRKLLTDVSAVAAEGSVFILNFLHREGDDNTLGEAEATATLTELGWADLEFSKYGDERLNFGRFPTGKFEPSAAFSFVVCRKGSK